MNLGCSILQSLLLIQWFPLWCGTQSAQQDIHGIMKSTKYVDKTPWLRYALVILYISLFELLRHCEYVLIKCNVTEHYIYVCGIWWSCFAGGMVSDKHTDITELLGTYWENNFEKKEKDPVDYPVELPYAGFIRREPIGEIPIIQKSKLSLRPLWWFKASKDF